MTGQNKRIGLITGANKGIGYEVARQLAASGCVILLGARSQTLGKGAAERLAAERIDVRYIPIDLDDPVTIKAAASMIDADFGHLDILINNAGIAVEGDGPPSTSSLEAIERDYRVNLIGTVAVTQVMLPLLRRAPSARIVNVSSGLGSLTKTSDPAFEFVAYKYLGYAASTTDLNGHRGTQPVAEGAVEIVRLALLPEDGPTGSFSNKNGVVPW